MMMEWEQFMKEKLQKDVEIPEFIDDAFESAFAELKPVKKKYRWHKLVAACIVFALLIPATWMFGGSPQSVQKDKKGTTQAISAGEETSKKTMQLKQSHKEEEKKAEKKNTKKKKAKKKVKKTAKNKAAKLKNAKKKTVTKKKSSAAKPTGPKIDEINFPDPYFRQYVIDYVDTNHTGYLSRKERAAVTEIHIKRFMNVADFDTTDEAFPGYPTYVESDYSIDFKGFEYFSQLQVLEMDYSNSDVLNENDIYGNDQKFKSRVSNIEYLYECKELRSITLDNMEFESFDMSMFPLLLKLELNQDQNE